MMKRKMTDILLRWKNNPDKKAMCIVGARQTGKTTIIKEFGRKHYDCFIEINFVEQPDAAWIFGGRLSADTIYTNLTAFCGKTIIPGKTLIFLDEIQQCPNARASIKFLVQDNRCDYIEAGSMLGVRHKHVPSYPVGFEELHYMYPMDFEEFLWANNIPTETIDYLRQCYQTKTPVSESIHQTMMRHFRQYIVVGGMPEAVNIFIQTHDMAKVIDYQRQILAQYRLDISQYAEGGEKTKIRTIFDSIPSQLNEKNRRFYINTLNGNARMNRYENSFLWLSDAGVALPCYNLTAPIPPVRLNEKHSLFKLFLSDTGMLCAACMENVQFPIMQGNLDINMGSILENMIAQHLRANGFDLYYYDSARHGEVDFVIQNGMHTELIEVKSGKDYRRHAALDHIMAVAEWELRHAVILCKDNILQDEAVTYLPWYMVMFIKNGSLSDLQPLS